MRQWGEGAQETREKQKSVIIYQHKQTHHIPVLLSFWIKPFWLEPFNLHNVWTKRTPRGPKKLPRVPKTPQEIPKRPQETPESVPGAP